MDWLTSPKMWRLPNDEVHLWRIDLDQPTNGLWELLSADEQERGQRFRFEHHRQLFVVGRGVLRLILGKYGDMPASTLAFSYGRQGKPYLTTQPSLQFNLSHSAKWALLAITRLETVGVDIEQIRQLPDMLGLAKRFFALTEYEQLRQLPAQQQAPAFFECWTRKEAYLKAIGEGLTHPLDQFSVTFGDGQLPRLLWVNGHPHEAERWQLWSVVPAFGYVGAMIVPAQNSSPCFYTFNRNRF